MYTSEDQKVLHQPFDIETHKKTFVHYLEIVILEDGTIEYAVPSHNKKLESICCKKLGIEDSIYPASPQLLDDFKLKHGNNWWDWEEYLYETSKTICVWENMYKGKPNTKQLNKLKLLKENNLYLGEIYATNN